MEKFHIIEETLDDKYKILYFPNSKRFFKVNDKAIELIKDTEGLEPYLQTFSDELNMFNSIIESLNYGIEELYSEISKVNFGRLKAVKKDKVSDVEALETVKSIRDSIKKKTSKLKYHKQITNFSFHFFPYLPWL